MFETFSDFVFPKRGSATVCVPRPKNKQERIEMDEVGKSRTSDCFSQISDSHLA